MRAYYASLNGIPDAGVATIVPRLVQEGVIPNNLTRNPVTAASCPQFYTIGAVKHYTCVDNPWGQKKDGVNVDANGTLQVCDWSFGGPQTGCSMPQTAEPVAPLLSTQFFAVALKGIPNGSCIHMAAQLSGSLGPMGLVDVDINSTNIVSGLGHPLPVTSTDLNLLCLAGSVNNITYVYRLTLPGG